MKTENRSYLRTITIVDMVIAAVIVVVVLTTFITLIGRSLFALSRTHALDTARFVGFIEANRLMSNNIDWWLYDESGFFDGTDNRVVEADDGRRYQIDRRVIHSSDTNAFTQSCSTVDGKAKQRRDRVALRVSTTPVGYGEVPAFEVVGVIVPSSEEEDEGSLSLNLITDDKDGYKPVPESAVVYLSSEDGERFVGRTRNGCIAFIGLSLKEYEITIETKEWKPKRFPRDLPVNAAQLKKGRNVILQYEFEKKMNV